MLIIKAKWIREKAEKIKAIVDSPASCYQCWDVVKAIEKELGITNKSTQDAILIEIHKLDNYQRVS